MRAFAFPGGRLIYIVWLDEFGHVFCAGVGKRAQPGEHDANALYAAMLREAIRRLDTFCAERPGG